MMAPPIHATCVALGGYGVLLMGPSGCGKSDLALRLIDRGARLVSDDYTCLEARDGRLIASAPANIAGKLEVRGIGIIARDALPEVVLALAVSLEASVERLPEPETLALHGIAIPHVRIVPFEATAPIKLEIALECPGT